MHVVERTEMWNFHPLDCFVYVQGVMTLSKHMCPGVLDNC